MRKKNRFYNELFLCFREDERRRSMVVRRRRRLASAGLADFTLLHEVSAILRSSERIFPFSGANSFLMAWTSVSEIFWSYESITSSMTESRDVVCPSPRM